MEAMVRWQERIAIDPEMPRARRPRARGAEEARRWF
jgi:hypothetical protein